MWWSIFTALAPSFFYFSVWQLSVSGQEIALISTLSPIFLGVSSVRAFLGTHRGRTWLQILSVLGLLAFKTESPPLRLVIVTCANILGSLLKAIEWGDQQEAKRHGMSKLRSTQRQSLTDPFNTSFCSWFDPFIPI